MLKLVSTQHNIPIFRFNGFTWRKDQPWWISCSRKDWPYPRFLIWRVVTVFNMKGSNRSVMLLFYIFYIFYISSRISKVRQMCFTTILLHMYYSKPHRRKEHTESLWMVEYRNKASICICFESLNFVVTFQNSRISIVRCKPQVVGKCVYPRKW